MLSSSSFNCLKNSSTTGVTICNLIWKNIKCIKTQRCLHFSGQMNCRRNNSSKALFTASITELHSISWLGPTTSVWLKKLSSKDSKQLRTGKVCRNCNENWILAKSRPEEKNQEVKRLISWNSSNLSQSSTLSFYREHHQDPEQVGEGT